MERDAHEQPAEHKDTVGDSEPDAVMRLTSVDREGSAPPLYSTETGEPHFSRGHSPAQEKMDQEELSEAERTHRAAAQPPPH